MRKVIQIAVDSQPASASWDGWVCVTALCNDGTVWELEYCNEAKKRKWRPVPPIPQDDVNTLITQPREVVPCNGAEKTPSAGCFSPASTD